MAGSHPEENPAPLPSPGTGSGSGSGSRLGARPQLGEPPTRSLEPSAQPARPGRRSGDVRGAAAGPSAGFHHFHFPSSAETGWAEPQPRGGPGPRRWSSQGRSGLRLRPAAFQFWVGVRKNFSLHVRSPQTFLPRAYLSLGGAITGWVRVAGGPGGGHSWELWSATSTGSSGITIPNSAAQPKVNPPAAGRGQWRTRVHRGRPHPEPVQPSLPSPKDKISWAHASKQ